MFAGVQAQVRKKKAAPSAEPKQTVEELLNSYKFEEAATQINKELTAAKRKQLSTDLLEEQLVTANMGMNMLSSTEDVVFIDSIVVDAEKVLSVYRISSECGKIDYLKNLMKSDKVDGNSIAYTPQLLDKIYFSATTDSATWLFTADRLDDSWSEPFRARGLEDFGYDQISPYVLADGSTLYFAAKGEESLGGYDIFMTRYSQDEGKFLRPENIGMPFNSPANDYLYVVDETNNLGWFATDRRQPEGKVCVYVFVPNETRKGYDMDSFEEVLPNFARINSIKDTWAGEGDIVKEATQRLKTAFNESQSESTSNDFEFVINNSKTYTSLQDFKNAKAKGYAQQWLTARKVYETQKAQLDASRDAYATADNATKKSMAKNILSAEKESQKLAAQISKLEKQIREEELKK